MKKLFSLLLGACTVFAACTDDVENIRQDGSIKLAVNVKVNPTSRAMVHGTALPGGSSIGINVTDATGNPYDGKDAGYLNVQYTATGEAGAQTWAPATDAVLLSGTEGKMHAYYPWMTGIDYTAVAVDVADQIDWMYAADAYTVSDAKNAHVIVLSHAQTAVNVNLKRDASYTGVGAVEALTVTSEGLASTASLDTRNGSFASVTGANTAISIIEAPYTLDGTILSSQENPYMFIPASTETKDFTVSATLDGKSYSHKVTMAEAFAPGKVYKINVTFKNTGLEVSTVTLVDWVETGLGDAEFKPQVPNADVPNISKVYAVRASDEALVEYDELDTDNEEYIAVALHVTGKDFEQKFWIEKDDGGSILNMNEDLYYKLVCCWTQTLSDLPLTNYQTGDGVQSEGAVIYPSKEGVEPTTSRDFTTWKAGALSDFNGKANTEVLVNHYNNYVEIGEAVQLYNQNQPKYKDWYIPSAGQMGLIYLNIDEINKILTAIGGKAFNTGTGPYFYWTSTEYDYTNAWRFHLGYGQLVWTFDDATKVDIGFLLYIRDY